ncbi:hypothetical protein [Gottfriedia luciferensis]|nr:hypothetical protein [Gottfriedia luciferensis]
MLKKTIALLIALFLFFTVKTGIAKEESKNFISFGNILPFTVSGK